MASTVSTINRVVYKSLFSNYRKKKFINLYLNLYRAVTTIILKPRIKIEKWELKRNKYNREKIF